MPLRPSNSAVNDSFTTGGISLKPHYFLGHPARGFAGIHFLEKGLFAGVQVARSRLAISLNNAFRKAALSGIRGISKGTVPRAGINLTVVNKVPSIERINVKSLLLEAFTAGRATAKRVADSEFRDNKGKTKPVITSGQRPSTTSSFNYETFVNGGVVGLGVTYTKDDKAKGKVNALNYGLKTSSRSFTGGDDDDD